MPPIRKSFQLDPDDDAALIAWLRSFADRYKTSDLIKLALYQMAEIEPSDHLRQLQAPQDAATQLALFGTENGSAQDDANAPTAPAPELSAQLQTIVQELAELRAALVERFADHAALQHPAPPRVDPAPEAPPPATSGEIESSGIDMGRPRRRKRATDPPPDPQEQALDPDALARELLRSIGSFGQNSS